MSGQARNRANMTMLTIRIFRDRFVESTLAVMFLLVLAACIQESPVAETKSHSTLAERAVETIADEYLTAYLERYPSLATELAIPGIRHDLLDDNSLSALAEWQQKEDRWLEEINALESLLEVGSRDWVSLGILKETLEAERAVRICQNELWRASSSTAWYTFMVSVFEIQPVDTQWLRQQALERLQKLVGFIDTEIANLRLGLDMGYSAPRMTVETSISEVLALTGENSPLLSPGRRAKDDVYMKSVQNLFEDELVPAIERYVSFIENEYLPRSREQVSLSFNKDGTECYPALIRYFSTVQLPAKEIHEIGLRQIARIRAEMQVIIDEDFDGDSVESFLRKINNDPEFTFNTEEEVLNYSLDALELAKQKASRVFGLQPRADVLIKPYPPYRESGTGEYQPSSEDGTRPGIYYMAVKDPRKRSRAIQLSVLYHETYPGHHLQGAIALELGDRVHPIARYLWNSGYVEGWGLYAERLADELGLYGTPLDRMGMLSDQAARASRLVVDTGLHTMGWSRQQAVDYFLANSGWPAGDIESEINRYIAYPGQANSYMLGMLEIMRLRELAKSELKNDFDLAGFHDRVLENGSITLPMLADSIQAWIGERRLLMAANSK